MDLFSRIIRKYKYLRNKYFIYRQKKYTKQQINLGKNKTPMIYLFCIPIHPNLGDQAQLMCIKEWFKEHFPEYTIAEICSRATPLDYLEQINKQIKPDDLIFIHSGYLFMNETTDVPMILDIAKTFKHNPIIILPQTVNFPSKTIEQNFQEIFNSNPNITLLCRDFISYDKAKILFPKIKCFAFPDIVTSLIGTFEYEHNREGICFCLRNDKEKFFSDVELSNLFNNLSAYKKTILDTTLIISPFKMNRYRKKIIYDMIKTLAYSRLVITDRYHGTIFSVIANTPVIIINSTDHKLSSGVKWFPTEIFGKAIQYAKDLNEANILAQQILRNEYHEFKNPKYFKEKYWDQLKNIIKQNK